jgi:hypothetical protein
LAGERLATPLGLPVRWVLVTGNVLLVLLCGDSFFSGVSKANAGITILSCSGDSLASWVLMGV